MGEAGQESMLSEISSIFDEAEERAAGLGVGFLVRELHEKIIRVLTRPPSGSFDRLLKTCDMEQIAGSESSYPQPCPARVPVESIYFPKQLTSYQGAPPKDFREFVERFAKRSPKAINEALRPYWKNKSFLEAAEGIVEDRMLPFIVGTVRNVSVRRDGRISVNRLENIIAVYLNGLKMVEGNHYTPRPEEGRVIWLEGFTFVASPSDQLTADIAAEKETT